MGTAATQSMVLDSPGEVGCGELPEETDRLGLRIELEDGAAAPWDAVDLACARDGGSEPVEKLCGAS